MIRSDVFKNTKQSIAILFLNSKSSCEARLNMLQ